MIVQIIAGVFGHVVNGTVKAVKAGEPPIEVREEVGKRLIENGVAVELVDKIPESATVHDGYNIDTGEFEDNADQTKDEKSGEGPEDSADQVKDEKSGVEPEDGADQVKDEKSGEELEDDAEQVEFPEYNADMTRPQLEEIGRELGLDESELKAAKNKAAVIAMLDEAKAEFEAEDVPNFDPEAAIK